MSGKSNTSESPTDFNDCVSKAELTKLLTDQRTFMETKFTELMGHINNVVTRIEQVEQRPPPQHEQRDDNDAAFDRDVDCL